MASDVIPISKQLGSNYNLIRVAALSGAAAVCLAAYGRHSMKETPETKEYRHIYESANNMHFIHSIALLATPLTKRPFIVNSFISLHCQFEIEERSFSYILIMHKIISDWIAFHLGHAAFQRHLLLQGHQKI